MELKQLFISQCKLLQTKKCLSAERIQGPLRCKKIVAQRLREDQISISDGIDVFLNARRHTGVVRETMNLFGKEEVAEFADELMLKKCILLIATRLYYNLRHLNLTLFSTNWCNYMFLWHLTVWAHKELCL